MKNRLRFCINIAIAVLVFGAWLYMFFAGKGDLSARGLRGLRFFTVQSNLLAALAAVIWLVQRDSNKWVETLKFVAAVSVFITFTVVACFLGPLYGFLSMYKGANLFFHLIVPVMAVLELMFLSVETANDRDNRLAMLPPLIYGCFYLGNVLINGIGTWPETNDWYGFLNWGYPVGMLIFAGICFLGWALGRLIRAVQRRRLKPIK